MFANIVKDLSPSKGRHICEEAYESDVWVKKDYGMDTSHTLNVDFVFLEEKADVSTT